MSQAILASCPDRLELGSGHGSGRTHVVTLLTNRQTNKLR